MWESILPGCKLCARGWTSVVRTNQRALTFQAWFWCDDQREKQLFGFSRWTWCFCSRPTSFWRWFIQSPKQFSWFLMVLCTKPSGTFGYRNNSLNIDGLKLNFLQAFIIPSRWILFNLGTQSFHSSNETLILRRQLDASGCEITWESIFPDLKLCALVAELSFMSELESLLSLKEAQRAALKALDGKKARRWIARMSFFFKQIPRRTSLVILCTKPSVVSD